MSDKFEDRLLADLVAAQQSIEPTGSPVAQRSQRRALRLGLAAVVIAGAVAAVLGLVVFNGGQPKASAAEIKQRALAAVTSANDLILHQDQTSTSFGFNSAGATTETIHEEIWQDLTAHKTRVMSYNPDGSPRSEAVFTHDGNTEMIEQVLYFAHLWITATGTLPFSVPTGGGSAQYAQNIEDQIANGEFVLVGPETINGQRTLHLRRHEPEPPRPPNFPSGYTPKWASEFDMWIDPTTYLPVQSEAVTSSGEVLAHTEYEWLPRTDADLANLDIVVPPGFKHETEQTQQGSSCSTQVTNGGTTRSCSFSFGSDQVPSHP